MRILQNANFTLPNLPTIPLPFISSPLQLGANLIGWWKADTGIAVSGSNVTTWADQSTENNGLTANSFGTASPTYNATGLGGVPAVQFPGSGTAGNLVANKFVSSAASPPGLSLLTGNVPFSVAVALKFANSGGINEILGMLEASYEIGWYLSADGGLPGIKIYASSSAYLAAASTTPMTAGGSYIIVANYAGTGKAAGVSVMVNGALQTMSTSSDTFSGTDVGTNYQEFTIGGGIAQGGVGGGSSPSQQGGYANSDLVGEVFVANRVLTAAEMLAASQYLNTRYTIY